LTVAEIIAAVDAGRDVHLSVEALAGLLRRSGYTTMHRDLFESRLGRKLSAFERRAWVIAQDSKTHKDKSTAQAANWLVQLMLSKRLKAVVSDARAYQQLEDGKRKNRRASAFARPAKLDQATSVPATTKAFAGIDKDNPISPVSFDHRMLGKIPAEAADAMRWVEHTIAKAPALRQKEGTWQDARKAVAERLARSARK
jgi:hypothetical protein